MNNRPPSEAASDDRSRIDARLNRIGRKILVLSGKGGVGKSTIAVNLAVGLMMMGRRVGLLDVDIHGPSIPTMLGLEGERVLQGDNGLLPVEVGDLKVMSIGFLLHSQDDAIIWRGPLKMGVIRQFLRDVDWGNLNDLVIDAPPGTGDELLAVCQLIGELDGAVVVTTPQRVAALDVRKAITFCRQLGIPILGVIENMSGFACPKCGEITPIFRIGGGAEMAREMGVPFWGSIPIDPAIPETCDSGRPFIHHHASSLTAGLMQEIVRHLTPSEMKQRRKES